MPTISASSRVSSTRVWAKRRDRSRLLDGKEVTPGTDVLVIADVEGAVGMAGVMGGQSHCACTDGRTDVLFEAAFFPPVAIRAAGVVRAW